jgi:hypothetical protein
LDGLSGVRSVGDINIGSNTALESISDLEGLTEFTGNIIHIGNNPLCTSVADEFVLYIRTLLPGSWYLADTVSGNADC